MSINDILSKLKYWDSVMLKWLMRSFYLTFFQIIFQIILVVTFFFWFINTLSVIDESSQQTSTLTERILVTQNTNINILVFLAILNSFWLLFMLNIMQSVKSLLKDITFNTSRIRNREKIL